MLLQKLENDQLFKSNEPPSFLTDNTMYLTLMGSHAYGVSTEDSDYDHYGFCIPPKGYLFPKNHIHGFGKGPPVYKNFEKDVWQIHHVYDKNGKEYDFHIYNIVKYFELCRQNNPSMIDSLFTSENCVTHCTQIGQMVRDKRRIFISKLVWKKFRGFASSQLKKMKDKESRKIVEELHKFEDDNKIPRSTTLLDVHEELDRRDMNRPRTTHLSHLANHLLKNYYDKYSTECSKCSRFESVKIRGFDPKFAYHVFRLLDESEQVLLTGDLNLERAKDQMRSIRNGEWGMSDIIAWYTEKEKSLESAYESCKLPEEPDEKEIRTLLFECLESHYGNIKDVYTPDGWEVEMLRKYDRIAEETRQHLYGK